MKLTPDQRLWVDRMLVAMDAAEAGPSAADLDRAPVLDAWHPLVSAQGAPILWGIVSGHPRLRDNDHITTSSLVALDDQNAWARTVSRWYRLAQPFSGFESDLAQSLGVEKSSGFLQLDIPGFQPLNNRNLLDRLLCAHGERIRNLDAADRAARDLREDG